MVTKIFVGNLNFQMTEDDLENLFSQFGKISELKMIKDFETGRSKGFGFITYSAQQEAELAISSMNGKDIEGRSLRVNLAENKERGGSGGGGFKRNSGGGGGGYNRNRY